MLPACSLHAPCLLPAYSLHAPCSDFGHCPPLLPLLARNRPLLPKHVFNPKLRRFNQCIASRALATLGGGGASSLLPVADERVTKPLIPDAALLSRAAPAIDAFAEACPLGVSTSGTKRKAAPIDGASGTPARKSQAQGIGEEGTDGFVADGSAAPMMLTSVVPSEIDSGNLISSFTMMLGDPKVDRTAAAFEGISNAIVDLLAACSSPEDAHAEKALTALRAVRAACSRVHGTLASRALTTRSRLSPHAPTPLPNRTPPPLTCALLGSSPPPTVSRHGRAARVGRVLQH